MAQTKELTKGLVDETAATPAQEQKPQAYCDRQGPGYDNDVSLKSWLRNGDATTKPGFDHTGKGTKEKV